MVKLRVLDVFSCVGFHSIGLQRAGEFEIVALCESNERRRDELNRLHPEAYIYDDIRTLPPIPADVVFGGPPCQRTSVAAAIHGKRTGDSLWPYMLRAILNSGAEWVVVEQPPGNTAWEAEVTNHLCRTGYHVARFVFGAEDVGAPYPRRRVYLIACTSLPRLEVAWQAGPSAIDRAKGAAIARGDWDPSTVPTFDVDTWRAEDVHERRERIEALGDSNPPAMAEVIGHMLLAGAAHNEWGSHPDQLSPMTVGPEDYFSPWPLSVIERLNERAKVARSEGTGTALGDAVHFELAAETISLLHRGVRA